MEIEKEEKEKMIDELFEALLLLDTKEECNAFFEDLCTYTEVMQMAQRIRAAKLLMQGMTYSQIIAKTEISSATLSRVSRCVSHGKGGYKNIVGKVLATKNETK